jgi:hypothetical protein
VSKGFGLGIDVDCIESEFLLLFQSDRQEALEKAYKNRLK